MDGVGQNIERAIDLRKKCGHFRILIIGRANAGKTTILKKVCDSTKDPKIFSPTGKKLQYSSVKGSAERGEHDIDNQLIFKSNPQFIFHDSRGFESGSVNETEKVKAFIEKRAATRDLSEQLHAIWYCLPTDTQRPLLEADTQFFNYSGTGKVSVIAIFAKFDGLVTTAFQNLRTEGKTRQEAMADAPNMAKRMLTTDYIDQLKKMNFPPSEYVRLDDMREKTSTCIELMAKTASSLDENALRLLLVSVQRNNLGLCIYYAVREGLETLTDLASARQRAETTLSYFPHIWQHEEYHRERDRLLRLRGFGLLGFEQETFDQNISHCMDALNHKFPNIEESIKAPVGCVELLALLCICAEQTFTEESAVDKNFGPAFSQAMVAYIGSSTEAEVIKESREIVDLPGIRFQQPLERIHDQAEMLTEVIRRHPLRIRGTKKGLIRRPW